MKTNNFIFGERLAMRDWPSQNVQRCDDLLKCLYVLKDVSKIGPVRLDYLTKFAERRIINRLLRPNCDTRFSLFLLSSCDVVLDIFWNSIVPPIRTMLL